MQNRRPRDLRIILFYQKVNSYALNILLGSLESAAFFNEIEICLAKSLDELEWLLKNPAPGCCSVVLWSFRSARFMECRRELERLKSRQRSAKIYHLAGGPHASALPAETLKAGFDLAAIGEGEQSLRQLVQALLENRELPALPAGFARLGPRQTLEISGRPPPLELDKFPAFAPRHERYNPIEITRGCIYGCHYCQTSQLFGSTYRHRGLAALMEAVKIMRRKNLFDLRFISPSALSYGSTNGQVRLEKVAALLEGVRETLGPAGRIFLGSFPSEIRPEHISHETLKLLKAHVANRNLIIGAQSGSERTLKAMRRGHGVENILEAVRLCRQSGFAVNVDLIFGYPGDDVDDWQRSLSLAGTLIKLGARIHAHSFMPLPGTPLGTARPAALTPEIITELGRLALKGGLYGQWEKQAALQGPE